MAMSGPALADEIRTSMGFPPPTTLQIIGWATGVVTHLQTSGSATTGGIPGPHPISGLSGPAMALLITGLAGYPFPSPDLINFCSAMATYIMANAEVTYTGPPPSAGNPDWFSGGTISGMDGADMASLVASSTGKPGATPELIDKCTAIVNHIQDNAEVENGVIA